MSDTTQHTANQPITQQQPETTLTAGSGRSERENRQFLRQHPALASFLSLYKMLRGFPSNLSREEALQEIESSLPNELQLRLADRLDQSLLEDPWEF